MKAYATATTWDYSEIIACREFNLPDRYQNNHIAMNVILAFAFTPEDRVKIKKHEHVHMMITSGRPPTKADLKVLKEADPQPDVVRYEP